jgi:hypothetical protein
MFQSVPLLHVAAPPARFAELDVRAVATALLAGAGILLAIWAPRSCRLVRRRLARAGAARLAAGGLMLLAALPAVFPYDHLSLDTSKSGDDAVHALHCHAAPDSCADAPISSGPGQLIFAEPLLAPPSSRMTPVFSTDATMRSVVREPDLRPPIA